ncbi:hypothetical protein DYI37_11615 [Fulvimarina endophytica]|uniref:Glycosyltransferase RgtA/B/C/D-like domain-containing protein n=1 Tax=Fulvimarina endophytica TaxID=2293836 RepID=A0A371X3Q1_9HYPH|nr:hypothetical protein [Fulvimarina endophytica]RFC63644.1 hypothetical protein DYI37_11615 [Fulvimarina endophytica]
MNANDQSSVRNRQLLLAETVTVIVLAALSLWAVRPLLEEWGLLETFRANGANFLLTSFPQMTLRPLHLVISYMQYALGGGSVIGVGVVAALLVTVRYIVARWAVSPILDGSARWAFATLSTALLIWPGLYFARFSAAQVSAILLMFVLGCSVRLYARRSLGLQLLSAGAVLILLLIYQASAVVLAGIPLLAFLIRIENSPFDVRARVGLALRIGVPIGLGFAVYGLYAFVASRLLGGGYESAIGGVLFSFAALAEHVRISYQTAYLGNALVLPAMLLVLAIGMFLGGWNAVQRSAIRMAVLTAVVLAILPLCALTYQLDVHLRDPERVLFPVSLGLCLLFLALLVAGEDRKTAPVITLPAVLMVTALLSQSAIGAIQVRGYWNLQKDVIFQTIDAVRQTGAKRFVLRDTTGELGDVYTLLPPHLNLALKWYRVDADVLLCTDDAVNRLHPLAARYPIPSTPRCSEVPQEGRVLLDAVASGSKIVVSVSK